MSDTAAHHVYMHIDALGAWYLAQVLTAMGSVTTLCFFSGLHLQMTQLQQQQFVFKYNGKLYLL
jgi:hypothetical protein